MATEELIVELDARTAQLDAKLTDSNKRLEKLEKQTKKNDKAFADFAKGAAASMAAVAAAVTVAARAAGQFAKELEVASTRFGVTTQEMQSLAFASDKVGISLEKLGDIGKDVNEKIGEFVATGGGGFQDFVDVMDLSADEAKDLALEFQKLSADQVMGQMVSRMEQAGISGQQMSFALEGLASDATDLIPLFRDNAKELKSYREEFELLGLALSDKQIEQIKKVNEEFTKSGSIFSAKSQQLIADYSSEITTAINWMTEFGLSVIDAGEIVANGWGNIVAIAKAGISDFINGTDTLSKVLVERGRITRDLIEGMANDSNDALDITITGGVKKAESSSKFFKIWNDKQIKDTKNYVKGMSALNSAFMDDNKAINAGLIVADTAASAMAAYKTGGPPAAFAAIAMGAAQLAANNSASKGGGSVSGGGASTGFIAPQTSQAPDTSTTIEVEDVATSQQQVVKIEFDGLDSFIEGVSRKIDDGKANGSL